MDKYDLSAMRLYVGCDNLGSIPSEINVIISSRSYRALINIEAKIMEPPEVVVSQERREWAEKNLENLLDPSRCTGSDVPTLLTAGNGTGEGRDPQIRVQETAAANKICP